MLAPINTASGIASVPSSSASLALVFVLVVVPSLSRGMFISVATFSPIPPPCTRTPTTVVVVVSFEFDLSTWLVVSSFVAPCGWSSVATWATLSSALRPAVSSCGPLVTSMAASSSNPSTMFGRCSSLVGMGGTADATCGVDVLPVSVAAAAKLEPMPSSSLSGVVVSMSKSCLGCRVICEGVGRAAVVGRVVSIPATTDGGSCFWSRSLIRSSSFFSPSFVGTMRPPSLLVLWGGCPCSL